MANLTRATAQPIDDFSRGQSPCLPMAVAQKMGSPEPKTKSCGLPWTLNVEPRFHMFSFAPRCTWHGSGSPADSELRLLGVPSRVATTELEACRPMRRVAVRGSVLASQNEAITIDVFVFERCSIHGNN